MKKTILVTGGAGYIGSHMVYCLLQSGHRPVVLDNLSAGSPNLPPKTVPLIRADLRSKKEIDRVFKQYAVDTVMHFAASISAPGSVERPLEYFQNNVCASIHLLESMLAHKVHKILFSSTAAVYGNPQRVPIDENCPVAPLNPYGQSKAMVEDILKDTARAGRLRYIVFRYFNACGAHPSGNITSSRDGSHLLSKIFGVLDGRMPFLPIYGTGYPTPDGTCIRDYIHVMDICRGHLLALEAFDRGIYNEIVNLGSQKGHSVRQTVEIARRVFAAALRTKDFKQRPGDPAVSIASCGKAKRLLNWRPIYDLESMMRTAHPAKNSGASRPLPIVKGRRHRSR
ncbi:MAG: UDP-glucose 4-epimerase GalE [Candidatus Omnitrophota bacterium]